MRVLVTGASGLVGRALIPALTDVGLQVRGVSGTTGPRLEDAAADWRPALTDCDVVVHLAARVHVTTPQASDAEAFEVANVQGTLRLAAQAKDVGVRRFVYVSTVKVHGESGHVTAETPCAPQDPYARSKHRAELGLQAHWPGSGRELVLVRPPLVYGPGARANLEALCAAVRRGWPLPLASVRNRRSLVGTSNLAEALTAAVCAPGAAGAAVAVADDTPISTPELIRAVADALGVRAHLWPVPVPVLRLGAAMVGRRAACDRLVGSLTIDPEPAQRALGWRARHSLATQLRQMVATQ